MNCRIPRLGDEKGQTLALFAIGLVALVGMLGLIIDGGDTFAQRRGQQNVADLAAMAGAYAYVSTPGDHATRASAATAAANTIATQNGFTTDNSTAVTVTVASALRRATVQVDVGRPHRNYFAGILGMPTWNVSTTATAITGAPNAAIGAMPLIFNEKSFNGDGYTINPPGMLYNEPDPGSEDVPQDHTQFNWTVFCTANGNPCNANSNTVRDIIEGHGVSTVVTLGDDIGPLNAGSHTTLFNAVEDMIGSIFPVAIVNDEGEMVGWAMFKLLSVDGGSEKVLGGDFIGPINATALTIDPSSDACPPSNPACGGNYGDWVVKLVN